MTALNCCQQSLSVSKVKAPDNGFQNHFIFAPQDLRHILDRVTLVQNWEEWIGDLGVAFPAGHGAPVRVALFALL
jgi:hypothetical protein